MTKWDFNIAGPDAENWLKIRQGWTDTSHESFFSNTFTLCTHHIVAQGVFGDIQFAQRKGLKFCQTRSNAIILYDTLPAFCISKAIVM